MYPSAECDCKLHLQRECHLNDADLFDLSTNGKYKILKKGRVRRVFGSEKPCWQVPCHRCFGRQRKISSFLSS